MNDIITTAEELDALPNHQALLIFDGQDVNTAICYELPGGRMWFTTVDAPSNLGDGYTSRRFAEYYIDNQEAGYHPVVLHMADQPTEPARVLPSREDLSDILRTHNTECTGLGEVSCQGCRDRGWMSWHAYRQHVADAVLALFASTPTVEQVKAEALREHRRRVVRFMPTGLVNRATVLADLDDYANRLAPAQPVPDVPEVGLPTAEVPNVGGGQHG